MTAVAERAPVFDPDATDPLWEQFRSRSSAGDWGIPRGTYDATVMSARVVRRRDNGEWGFRILFRVDRLGLDGYAWRQLSRNTSDPLDLSKGQIKSLREWARKMGVSASAPSDIVGALEHLPGRKIVARISMSPDKKSRASLSRVEETTTGGPSSLSSGTRSSSPALVDASDVTKAAHTAHQALHDAVTNINTLWMIAAEACYHLREGQGWSHLGFDSLNEYLAQPELGMERARFLKLAQIWDVFHIQGGVPREELAGAKWSKLHVTARALTAGEVTPAEAVADAAALARRDLEDKYRTGLPGETTTNDFKERVSDLIVSPLIDPDRGRLLSVQVGDRHAELDRERAERLYATVGEWLEAVTSA